MKAAMFHGPHQPLTIENVDIDKPAGREVLVRVVASGVCHSDLHFVDGYYPFPTPAILGHEAAGIVEAVGPQVVCASDACYTRENMDRDVLPNILWNASVMRDSLATLRKLRDGAGATMYYGHDPAQWQTMPQAPAPLL